MSTTRGAAFAAGLVMEARMADGRPFDPATLRAIPGLDPTLNLHKIGCRAIQRWRERGWITHCGEQRRGEWELTPAYYEVKNAPPDPYVSTREAGAILGVGPFAIHQSYQDGAPMPLERYKVGGRGVGGGTVGRLPRAWVEKVKRIADMLGVPARRAMHIAPHASFDAAGVLTIRPAPVASPSPPVQRIPPELVRAVKVSKMLETIRAVPASAG